jgi:transcriptional regulator with XRE-family HTH domain
MEFHERLVLLCQSRRIRRGAIVDALNESGDPRLSASKSTVGRWFNGQGEPSIHQLCYLARLLGTTFDAFCAGPGEGPAADPDASRSPTQDELLIITVARRLGFERALGRLLVVDTTGGD